VFRKQNACLILGRRNILRPGRGLVDEFFIHIAPVFLGSGIRLFDGMDKDKYDIQIAEVIPSGLTTHVRYKLTKK
jgi:riboflavin biosynthesis pyrimidine reductase